MKNKINFSSHSGFTRFNESKHEMKPNYNNNNYNIENINNINNFTFKNLNRQNSSRKFSKTPEGNRFKKSSTSKEKNKQEKLPNKSNENQINSFPLVGNDLAFNMNDDFQTLIFKNTKLREFIENSLQKSKTESQLEKEDMVTQLDKITNNYKLYSDYYSKYFSLVEKINLLEKDYKHNTKVMNNFKESLKKLLIENIDNYKSADEFLLSLTNTYKKNSNPEKIIIENNETNSKKALDFLLHLKEKILASLQDSKNFVDRVNFPETWMLLKNTLQQNNLKVNLRDSHAENHRSNSKEAKSRNFNKDINNMSFTIHQNDFIKDKNNSIQIENENKSSILNNTNNNKINDNNNKNCQLNTRELDRFFKGKKSNNKSRSADSFYPIKKLHNKDFDKKNTYSFKNFQNNAKNDNNVSQNSNLFQLDSKFNCQDNFNKNINYKDVSNQESNDVMNCLNEKVDLNGLFYNERFSHYNVENKKRLNKTTNDTIEQDDSFLKRSTSYNNFIKKDLLSKKDKNFNNSLKFNNSLLKPQGMESKKILSSHNNNFNSNHNNNNYNNKNNGFIDFSKDSLNNNSQILYASEFGNNDEHNTNYNNIEDNNITNAKDNDNIEKENKELEHSSKENFDNAYFNFSDNRNLDLKYKNFNKNTLIKDSLISPNYTSLDSNNQTKFKYINSENNFNYKSKLDELNKNSNYNYTYNLYDENIEKYNNSLNRIDKLNDKLLGKNTPTQIVQARLKRDFFIENLNILLFKGESVDIIFIPGSDNLKNKYSNINFDEKFKIDKSFENKFDLKCFLIYEGSHYPIANEYFEINREL